MEASELKEKGLDDLLQRETNLTAEAFNLKFKLATEQLTDTAKLRSVKRDLARVKTVMRERELGMHNGPNTESPESEEA